MHLEQEELPGTVDPKLSQIKKLAEGWVEACREAKEAKEAVQEAADLLQEKMHQLGIPRMVIGGKVFFLEVKEKIKIEKGTPKGPRIE